jgi:sortase A
MVRRINPLTATGTLLMLVAATALITYAAITVPPRLKAAGGPPEAFRQAATSQAADVPISAANVDPTSSTSGALTPVGTPTAQEAAAPTPGGPTPTLRVAIPSSALTPTAAPDIDLDGAHTIPDWVEERYWLSIPAIDLEAAVMAFEPRQRDADGIPVMRLPVPNTYVVGWDSTSAEPGFAGNTIMAGHNNLFGAVFGGLYDLEIGDEVAVWSELGVFSYHVSEVMLLEEEGQPLEVRYQNAQWLNDTPEDRLTLITCWPRNSYTHRLLVIATR